MTRFARSLQRIGDRLDLPEPSRTRILLEVASDLEDSYRHYLSQGCNEAEAVRRAEETFGASDEALGLLARIHRSGIGSVADRLSQQIGSLWAKFLLTVLLAFEILLAGKILTDPFFLLYPSPFLWPIAVLGIAAFCFTVWKLAQILRPSGADVRRFRTGLTIPLFFAGASLAVAGCGFLFHLQRFFRLNAMEAPEALIMNFAGWMISISSLMTLGLLVAIFAGLVWFILTGLATRSEARTMQDLLRAAA